jgi:RNA polymerase sigma-B factor
MVKAVSPSQSVVCRVENLVGSSGKGPPAEATARLLRAYHVNGDSSARERLIELYMPLVASLARRHARAGQDYDDLVQAGSIGLIKAIDRFDLERGTELASFAIPTISGEMKRHLRDRGETVRLPRPMAELRGRATAARDELTARLGREPSWAELATELGVDEHAVAAALTAQRATADDASLREAVGAGSTEERVLLAEAFEGLDERERRILYLRYVRDLEPDRVASELGISRRHLSRQTQAALAKLRGGLGDAPAERLSGPPRRPKMAPMQSVRSAASYLDLPYHIVLVREDGGWVARVEELAGCEARGDSADEATDAIHEAMRDWISDALEHRREIPAPRDASSYSGKLMLRMPGSLHAELARAAERDNVSLNQFITSSLAGVVGWRSPNGAAGAPAGAVGPQPDERAGSGGGWLKRAILANAVLLALAGIAAAALLVVALTHA